MYLENFPCSKTPANNATIAVRNIIIKTLI
jgi:hypothetical protein